MKNVRMIILVFLITVLAGALIYLAYLISNGSNPLTMLNLRASNPEEEIDPFLAENEITTEPTAAPTGLLAFNSTSPSPVPSKSASPSGTITVTIDPSLALSGSPSASLSPSPSLTPTLSPTPTVVNVVLSTSTPIPTTVQTLPVSGITDHVDKILVGGGILILLGLLL